MKKLIYSVLALMALGLSSCNHATPDPDKGPEYKNNVIYVLDAEGSISREIEVASATSFVLNGGYLSFYFGSMEGLTPELVTDDFEAGEGESIVGAAILNSFNGKRVNFSKETRRYNMIARIDGFEEINANENALSENLESGWFLLKIDMESQKATYRTEMKLTDGQTIKAVVEAEYIPGGENENYVVLGEDYERPLRVGFYDKAMKSGFEPTLYVAVGEIEYGEDLTRTTFTGIAASSKLCDGKPHEISDAIGAGDLSLIFYTIDEHSSWTIISGQFMMEKKGKYDYEISISGAFAKDDSGESEDRRFDFFWSGKFKDANVARPIPNKVEYNGSAMELKSAVIDITSRPAYVYFCPSAGITTAEAAAADSPVVITVTASKVFTNVGLSTDREQFSISYAGNLWNKDNLSTCSYIVHEYSEEDSIFHCQIASFSLQEGKTTFKLEYKGYATVLR